MNRVLASQLHKRYPRTFTGERGPICFELHDGWYELLSEMAARIEPLLDRGTFVPLQIKEKFGHLRFYCVYHDFSVEDGDRISAAIEAAEARSARTCEDCGAIGKCAVRNNWICVLCKQCERKRYPDGPEAA